MKKVTEKTDLKNLKKGDEIYNFRGAFIRRCCFQGCDEENIYFFELENKNIPLVYPFELLKKIDFGIFIGYDELKAANLMRKFHSEELERIDLFIANLKALAEKNNKILNDE